MVLLFVKSAVIYLNMSLPLSVYELKSSISPFLNTIQ